MADLHRQILDISPGPIFLIFMQFLGEFGRKLDWRPFSFGVGASFWHNLDPLPSIATGMQSGNRPYYPT